MLNKWSGQGRLTRDIELRSTPGGISVATFTLACDRDFKNQDGSRDADFIDVVAWRGSAEFAAKHFSKGDMMILSGRIQTRTYDDKNGNHRKATEIVADSINFGGSRRNDGGSQAEANEGFQPVEDGFEELGAQDIASIFGD